MEIHGVSMLLLARLHIVYGARPAMVAGVCCRLSSSVTRRICNVTHTEAALGGPVVLRPVRATPCFRMFLRM